MLREPIIRFGLHGGIEIHFHYTINICGTGALKHNILQPRHSTTTMISTASSRMHLDSSIVFISLSSIEGLACACSWRIFGPPMYKSRRSISGVEMADNALFTTPGLSHSTLLIIRHRKLRRIQWRASEHLRLMRHA